MLFSPSYLHNLGLDIMGLKLLQLCDWAVGNPLGVWGWTCFMYKNNWGDRHPIMVLMVVKSLWKSRWVSFSVYVFVVPWSPFHFEVWLCSVLSKVSARVLEQRPSCGTHFLTYDAHQPQVFAIQPTLVLLTLYCQIKVNNTLLKREWHELWLGWLQWQ